MLASSVTTECIKLWVTILNKDVLKLGAHECLSSFDLMVEAMLMVENSRKIGKIIVLIYSS